MSEVTIGWGVLSRFLVSVKRPLKVEGDVALGLSWDFFLDCSLGGCGALEPG